MQKKTVFLIDMTENNDIQEILLRYLNGESTDEEAKILHDWINKSKDNKESFEFTSRLWADSAEGVLLPVDTEKAWQTVRSQTIGNQPKVVSMFSWKKALAIAASVVLIVGIFYYYNQSAKTVWKDTLAIEDNKKVQLPDGTTIIMRKGSKLSLPDNYGREKREVKLDGEAYFEVIHNAANPFAAITTRSIVQDIGTSFLLQSTDSLEQVTVLEGEVSFTGIIKNENNLILKAGESAVLSNEVPQKKIINTTNLLSWNSGLLVFNNTPLWQAIKDIGDYYRVGFALPDSLGAVQITAEFRNESLQQVLKELQLFTGLKFEMTGNKIVISK